MRGDVEEYGMLTIIANKDNITKNFKFFIQRMITILISKGMKFLKQFVNTSLVYAEIRNRTLPHFVFSIAGTSPQSAKFITSGS